MVYHQYLQGAGAVRMYTRDAGLGHAVDEQSDSERSAVNGIAEHGGEVAAQLT